MRSEMRHGFVTGAKKDDGSCYLERVSIKNKAEKTTTIIIIITIITGYFIHHTAPE